MPTEGFREGQSVQIGEWQIREVRDPRRKACVTALIVAILIMTAVVTVAAVAIYEVMALARCLVRRLQE